MSESEARLSVVVASQGPARHVERCLAELDRQRPDGIAEIILVTNAPDASQDALRRAFPSVDIVCCPDAELVPHLWGAGVLRGREGLVALTTSEMVPATGWATALLAHHREHAWAGVGGAILPAPGLGPVDAAIYWLRYHRFADEPADGPVSDIAGDNACYRRSALAPYLDRIARDGFWEYELNQTLLAAGQRLCLAPEAAVRYVGGESFGVFARQRLTHGQRFGRERVAHATRLRRWLLLATWPLTPAVLLARVLRGAAAARSLRPLVPAMPALLTLIGCWSVGELFGYVHGASVVRP
ncbi:MAG TPA: hypothetical protein VKV73_01880 [Chloroflexota bacterium]|nr:hypothetical protein [Chloroflexota bacterium]